MNTWRIILATMVIFGAGVVTGGLLVRHSETLQAPLSSPTQGVRTHTASAGGMKLEFLRRAQRELDLTKEQREQVDKVITQGQERIRGLMEPVAPQMREEVQKTRDQFREVLTPAQRARFDEFLKHQQRPRDQHRPNHERRQNPASNSTNSPG